MPIIGPEEDDEEWYDSVDDDPYPDDPDSVPPGYWREPNWDVKPDPIETDHNDPGY